MLTGFFYLEASYRLIRLCFVRLPRRRVVYFDRHAEVSFLFGYKKVQDMIDAIIELNNDNFYDYPDIDVQHVQFLMYAEGGAMGEPGAVNIITQKGEAVRCYHANCLFGDFNWNHIKFILDEIERFCDEDPDENSFHNQYFHYVDLGFGNHLFVRKRYEKAFDSAFENASCGEIYQGWFDVAKELLKSKSEWKYCVVGNIVHERIDKAGILRYGTAQFTGGTRVYLCGRYWNSDREDITVIGLNRRNHYEATEVPVSAIENVRCSRVYKPKVLEMMNNFEFWHCWWSNSPEDKKEIAAFVDQWGKKF